MAKGQPIILKMATVAATAFLLLAVAGAAFVAGYGLCFERFTDAYSELSVLKARALELEEEILHLKNYAVLIDALSTHGKAAQELRHLPLPQTTVAKDHQTAWGDSENCSETSVVSTQHQ